MSDLNTWSTDSIMEGKFSWKNMHKFQITIYHFFITHLTVPKPTLDHYTDRESALLT